MGLCYIWMIDLTLAPPWGQFRLCPALLWASEGSIGALWDHTLDSTLAYEADCGSLWCQFGITLGRVGVALTSLWGHFAHLGVGLGSLWADFWIIWGSLCSCLAYEGPFSKTLVSLCFLTILTALVWTRSHFGVMLGGFGWLWGHFWHMRLSLGHFEIT